MSKKPSILIIHGGSSSIKFALFRTSEPLERSLYGIVDRIGLSGTNLTFNNTTEDQQVGLAASDHRSATNALIDWLEKQPGFASVMAVGHRVVHGMKHTEPELVTQKLLNELHHIMPYDPDHLPGVIELIKALRRIWSKPKR